MSDLNGEDSSRGSPDGWHRLPGSVGIPFRFPRLIHLAMHGVDLCWTDARGISRDDISPSIKIDAICRTSLQLEGDRVMRLAGARTVLALALGGPHMPGVPFRFPTFLGSSPLSTSPESTSPGKLLCSGGGKLGQPNGLSGPDGPHGQVGQPSPTAAAVLSTLAHSTSPGELLCTGAGHLGHPKGWPGSRRSFSVTTAGVGSVHDAPTAACGVLGATLGRLLDHPKSASSAQLVAAAQNCSAHGLRCEETLSPIAEAAMLKMKSDLMDPHQLAELSLALCTVGYFNVKYHHELAEATIRRIGEFSPEDISNVAWALGQAQYSHYPVMSLIAERVESEVSDFSATQLARVLWSCAQLRYQDPRLPVLILDAVDKLIKQEGPLCPSSLSEVAEAVAAVGGDVDPRLLQLLSDQVPNNIQNFTPRELILLMSSLESLGLVGDRSLMDAVEARLEHFLHQDRKRQQLREDGGQRDAVMADTIDPASAARIAFALRKCGECNPSLLLSLAAHVVANLESYDAGQLQQLVESFNSLNFTDSCVATIAAHLQRMEPYQVEDKTYQHARLKAKRASLRTPPS